MEVNWTENSVEHLAGIRDYISRVSTVYANRTIDQITGSVIQIGDFPLSGHKVREYNAEQVREITVASYRVIYHVRVDRIDIIAVLHGSQNTLRGTPIHDE